MLLLLVFSVSLLDFLCAVWCSWLAGWPSIYVGMFECSPAWIALSMDGFRASGKMEINKLRDLSCVVVKTSSKLSLVSLTSFIVVANNSVFLSVSVPQAQQKES